MSTVLMSSIPAIRPAAPLAGLRVNPWSEETILALERGELDWALYADDTIPPDFHYRTLFQDSYSLVCRAGHPLRRHRRLGQPSY